MRERDTQILSVISALVIGGIIGAGITLLVAPQSGEETRDLLRNKSMEIRDKAVETASDTRERASKALNDVAQQTKDRVSFISKRSQDVIEEGKQRIDEKMHTA